VHLNTLTHSFNIWCLHPNIGISLSLYLSLRACVHVHVHVHVCVCVCASLSACAPRMCSSTLLGLCCHHHWCIHLYFSSRVILYDPRRQCIVSTILASVLQLDRSQVVSLPACLCVCVCVCSVWNWSHHACHPTSFCIFETLFSSPAYLKCVV
jgi:hypothetical protein